jgi:organic radical activating enzyme
MLTLDKKEIIDLEIETSTICQANCPLCYRNYKIFDSVYPKIIQRDFLEIIDELKEYENLKYIRLVGSVSEPTLYKEFIPLVRYIKSRGIEIEICTNGSTHDTCWWEKLASHLDKNDKVYFTICGSTQELHEIYRKNTNLKKILKNAESFRKINPIDYAQCIRFDYNSDNFDSDHFKEMVSNFTNVYWTETFLKKSQDNYTNTENLEKLKPNSKKIQSYLNIEKLANKRKNKPRTCKAYNDKSQIMDIYGKIYPCYLFMESQNGKEWDNDYSKILNGDYDVCKFCEKGIVKMLESADLTYII